MWFFNIVIIFRKKAFQFYFHTVLFNLIKKCFLHTSTSPLALVITDNGVTWIWFDWCRRPGHLVFDAPCSDVFKCVVTVWQCLVIIVYLTVFYLQLKSVITPHYISFLPCLMWKFVPPVWCAHSDPMSHRFLQLYDKCTYIVFIGTNIIQK